MTPEEVAELYLAQCDWTYEQSEAYDGEWGLTIWEEWITDDPERAWPVFTAIVARRADDETLQQAGYRLRLLLHHHWDAFHERAAALVRATPRFARVVGEDFFDPATYRDEPLDVGKLIEAYQAMDLSHAGAYRVREIAGSDAERGLVLTIEIIHRGPQHGFGSYDTFSPLQDLIDAHGMPVIAAVEDAARHSVLLRRALWRMHARERNIPPRHGEMAEVWRRAIAAHGTTTDFTDDDAPLPAPRALYEEDERIVEAWFVHEENFWAFDAVYSLVRDDPEGAWPVILRLLDRAEGQTVFSIAAGPLEDFLKAYGPQFIERIAEEVSRNAKLRDALTGVWLNEEDAVYERVRNLIGDQP